MKKLLFGLIVLVALLSMPMVAMALESTSTSMTVAARLSSVGISFSDQYPDPWYIKSGTNTFSSYGRTDPDIYYVDMDVTAIGRWRVTIQSEAQHDGKLCNAGEVTCLTNTIALKSILTGRGDNAWTVPTTAGTNVLEDDVNSGEFDIDLQQVVVGGTDVTTDPLHIFVNAAIAVY